MGCPTSLGIAALVALSLASPAYAFDETKYPDLSGVWRKPPGIGNQWDQTKPLGLAQEPPFTPEYRAIFEASLADISAGGQGNDWPSRCVPLAMPRVMTVVFDMEIVVTPRTTYMLFAHSMPRRIITDGSDWPKEIEPTFLGYSVGRWIDTDDDGRYDVLEIETRGLKGPRTYEGTGMPFHEDGQTVVKERLYLDKANRDILHDEITLIDHAYTRPWTITKSYPRYNNPGPTGWPEEVCAEAQVWVTIGNEDYYLSADGTLMPTKKDQAPPDLRYFKPIGK